MKIRYRVGKALTLALCSVSFASCDRLPFAGNQADSSALQSSVSDPQARAFYAARQWKDAWDKKAEKRLLEIIAGAPANGLKPDLFLKAPLPTGAAEREAALTTAALKYASALASGYADPKKIVEVYTIPRAKADVAAGLAKALEGNDLKTWFASLPPQTDEYRALSEAHLRYLKQAAQIRPQPIPEGKPIKPEKSDPRAEAVGAALTAIGYLPASQVNRHRTGIYDRALVDGVKRLQ